MNLEKIKASGFFNIEKPVIKKGIINLDDIKINERLIQRIEKNYYIFPDILREYIKKNEFNSHTCIYHLLAKREERVGILRE